MPRGIVELDSAVEAKREENVALRIHGDVLNITERKFDRRQWKVISCKGNQASAEEAK